MAYRLRKASLKWWHLNCLKDKRNLVIWGMEERLFQAGNSRCRERHEIRKIGERYLRNWETLCMVACAVCLVAQSCPTLCESVDWNPPGSCPWEFSRQGYWNGLSCPPPADLPNPGIEPRSPTLQVDSLPSEPPGKPWNIFTDGESGVRWSWRQRSRTVCHCFLQALAKRSYFTC